MKSSMSFGKESEHCLLDRTDDDGYWKRVSFMKRRFFVMQRVLVELIFGMGIIVEVKFVKGDIGRLMFVLSCVSVNVNGKEDKAKKRCSSSSSSCVKGSILNEIVLNNLI